MLSSMGLYLMITGTRVRCLTNSAKLAFAYKSDFKTFKSLYNDALLILDESSKSKK